MLSSIEKVRLGVINSVEFKNAERLKRSMDLQLSQTIRVDQCHKSSITSMDIDSTGRYLISTSYGQFFIHDTFNFTDDLKYKVRKICKSGTQDQYFKGLSNIQWFPNDSGLFTISSSRGTICLYNTNALKKPLETFGGTTNECYLNHHMNTINPQLISAISVIPNSNAHKINIIDVRIGSSIQTLPSNSRNGLLRGSVGLSSKTDFDYCQLRWSPKRNTYLSTGTSQGQIIEWDIRSTLSYVRTYGADTNCDIPPVKRSKVSLPNEILKAHRRKVMSLRYSKDGNELFSLGFEGTICRFREGKGHPTMSYYLPEARNINLASMDISSESNSPTIYTAWGPFLYIYNGETGELHRRLRGHLKSISSFVYDDKYQYAYSGGTDCGMIVYSPNYLAEKTYLDNLTSCSTYEDFVSKAPLIDMSDL